MYAILSILFFIAAFFSMVIDGNFEHFIGLSIGSALFGIAAGISSIYVAFINKMNNKNKQN